MSTIGKSSDNQNHVFDAFSAHEKPIHKTNALSEIFNFSLYQILPFSKSLRREQERLLQLKQKEKLYNYVTNRQRLAR